MSNMKHSARVITTYDMPHTEDTANKRKEMINKSYSDLPIRSQGCETHGIQEQLDYYQY